MTKHRTGVKPNGTVVIFGITSPIARFAAITFAERGYDIHVTARQEADIASAIADLRVRSPERHVSGSVMSAADADLPARIQTAYKTFQSDLVGAVMAWGSMADPQDSGFYAGTDIAAMAASNYTGPAIALETIAAMLSAGGFLIGISSVAGDRGRQSNYGYGAAKAGFSAFLSGLRNKMHSRGVRVITVKPGFVDTRMTFGKKGLFLVADPKDIGAAIANSIDCKCDIRYLPFFWRGIMSIIKSIPEAIFKKLKL